MRVRGGRKWNANLHRQFDDSIAGIKFVHWFAPTSGGKLNRKIARTDKFKCLVDQRADVFRRSMSMDFDQIQVGKRVDQPSRDRSEEHTSELQSRRDLVCRL